MNGFNSYIVMLRLAEFELGTGILWFLECAPVTTIKSQYLPSFHFTVFVAMSLAGQTRSFTHCVTLFHTFWLPDISKAPRKAGEQRVLLVSSGCRLLQSCITVHQLIVANSCRWVPDSCHWRMNTLSCLHSAVHSMQCAQAVDWTNQQTADIHLSGPDSGTVFIWL